MRTFGALKALAEGTPGARKPTLANSSSGVQTQKFAADLRSVRVNQAVVGQYESVIAPDASPGSGRSPT
jgi:hypothetical protein